MHKKPPAFLKLFLSLLNLFFIYGKFSLKGLCVYAYIYVYTPMYTCIYTHTSIYSHAHTGLDFAIMWSKRRQFSLCALMGKSAPCYPEQMTSRWPPCRPEGCLLVCHTACTLPRSNTALCSLWCSPNRGQSPMSLRLPTYVCRADSICSTQLSPAIGFDISFLLSCRPGERK